MSSLPSSSVVVLAMARAAAGEKWMDGWMYGWMDVWIDVYLYVFMYMCVCVCARARTSVVIVARRRRVCLLTHSAQRGDDATVRSAPLFYS